MRIVCPSCEATYDVPDAVAISRRTVRCARCKTEFQAQPEAGSLAAQVAPPPPEPVQPDPAPAPEPRASEADRFVREAEAPRPGMGFRTAVLAGWALSLLLLAAGAWAVITWRQPLMRTWPASTRLYATLGYLR